jgi:hypothetical protein
LRMSAPKSNYGQKNENDLFHRLKIKNRPNSSAYFSLQ